MTSYLKQYKELNQCFKQGIESHLEKNNIDICFFSFHSFSNEGKNKISDYWDNNITENFSFEYPVFTPSEKKKFNEAIVLLHGLNERSWDKYLPWAEYICNHTRKPVILFPLAFHINRSPLSWSNPRSLSLSQLLNFRREKFNGDRSISYANVALSDRISQFPERFYLSGRQSWEDLTILFEEIKTGHHTLFGEGAQIDIFSYSIGTFLSQVALMANDKDLFSDSRLFMFCGGSIFRSMFGISRSIMDKPAFEKLQHYYINVFGNEKAPIWKQDNGFNAFMRMITPERMKSKREKLFSGLAKRIKGIVLAKDQVIPYNGVLEALGRKTAEATVQLIDFPFPYTHENPFPINTKDASSVNRAFVNVFSQAVEFLI